MGKEAESEPIVVCVADVEPVSEPFCGEADSGYRRGVSQALSMAADIVKAGYGYAALCSLCDESMVMRYDRKPYPAYLDELRSRFWKHRKKNAAKT